MQQIEWLIESENWEAARRAIRNDLARRPDDHWLLTRLGLTYYEQRRYKTALQYSEKALKLVPQCPLALWDHAGTLDMLGREAEAVKIYTKLIGRGVQRLANGQCGEGVRWARGLVADCWYRLAGCHDGLGDRPAAVRAIRKHLKLRTTGSKSTYSIKSARELLKTLTQQ